MPADVHYELCGGGGGEEVSQDCRPSLQATAHKPPPLPLPPPLSITHFSSVQTGQNTLAPGPPRKPALGLQRRQKHCVDRTGKTIRFSQDPMGGALERSAHKQLPDGPLGRQLTWPQNTGRGSCCTETQQENIPATPLLTPQFSARSSLFLLQLGKENNFASTCTVTKDKLTRETQMQD